MLRGRFLRSFSISTYNWLQLLILSLLLLATTAAATHYTEAQADQNQNHSTKYYKINPHIIHCAQVSERNTRCALVHCPHRHLRSQSSAFIQEPDWQTPFSTFSFELTKPEEAKNEPEEGEPAELA